MPRPRYLWRQLLPDQRREVLEWRKQSASPWHAPPHRPNNGHITFHVTAACYEHRPRIGWNPERMESFSRSLLETIRNDGACVVAWCVLPNHYHLLLETTDILRLLQVLGRLHGRTAHAWNGEENARGRQVFHRAVERAMRSDGHRHATINYVHHNPVHHGYASTWTDWPWSSATDYLAQVGREEAERRWKRHPILDYGRGWDDAAL